MVERDRFELHQILVKLLGSKNVFYQKPTKTLTYPCIVYDKNNYDIRYSNNAIYKNMTRYTITFMCQSKTKTNNDICLKFFDLPYCSFVRNFVSDNISHDVFEIYF